MQQTAHKILKLAAYCLVLAVTFVVSFLFGGFRGSSQHGIAAFTGIIPAHADAPVILGDSSGSGDGKNGDSSGDSGSDGCGDGGGGGCGGSSDGGGADGSGCGSTGDSV